VHVAAAHERGILGVLREHGARQRVAYSNARASPASATQSPSSVNMRTPWS
jgi:hypothetical protein